MARLSAILIALVLASSAALAQAPSGEPVPQAEAAEPQSDSPYDAAGASQEGFRAATGPGDADTVPGGQLMLIAYLVFLALLGYYSTLLSRRHTVIQGELTALRRHLEDLDDRLDAKEARAQG